MILACFCHSWTSLFLLVLYLLFGGGQATTPTPPTSSPSRISNGIPTKDVGVVDFCIHCVGKFGTAFQELNNVTAAAASISEVVHKKSDRLCNAIFGWRWSVQPMLIDFVERWMKDDKLSKSYEMWRSVFDSPGVRRALQNSIVQEQLKSTAANILMSHISTRKLHAIQVAVNTTAEVAIDIIENNIGVDAESVIQIMVEYASDADAALQGIVASRATPYFCSPEYASVLQFFSENRVLPRLMISSMAAVLCGFDIRTDTFLNAIVGAYAMSHLTREKALSMLAFVDEILGSGSIGKETLPSAMKLLVCSSSCDDMESNLGKESLEFFSRLRLALNGSNGNAAVTSYPPPKLLTRSHPLSTEVRLLIALTRVLRLGKRNTPGETMWGGWFPMKLLNRSFWYTSSTKGSEYNKSVGEKQQLDHYAEAAREAGVAQHFMSNQPPQDEHSTTIDVNQTSKGFK
eukprot:271765_1